MCSRVFPLDRPLPVKAFRETELIYHLITPDRETYDTPHLLYYRFSRVESRTSDPQVIMLRV